MFKFLQRIYWYIVRHLFVSLNSVVDLQLRSIKHSQMAVCSNSRCSIGKDASISKSNIQLHEGAVLEIEEGVVLRHVTIDLRASKMIISEASQLENCHLVAFNNANILIGKHTIGKDIEWMIEHSDVELGNSVRLSDWKLMIEEESQLHLGDAVVCEKGNYWCGPEWSISGKSKVEIGEHNRVRNKLWIRFRAHLTIGKYNCINEGTEIRADERIEIGSYNMISYNCRIWDTDTHHFYKDDTRRKMTERMYPDIGVEVDRPRTKFVHIGDDCLVGEGAVVLKGSKIGNKVKVGTRAVVSNMDVEDNHVVVSGKGTVMR